MGRPGGRPGLNQAWEWARPESRPGYPDGPHTARSAPLSEVKSPSAESRRGGGLAPLARHVER